MRSILSNLLRRLKVRGKADNDMTNLSSSSSSCPPRPSSSIGGTSVGASMMSTDNAKQQNTIHPILKRLQQNDTSLTSLLILESGKPTKKSTIYYRPRNVQDWELLGQAIATNTNLIRLDIKLVQHTYHNSSRHSPQTLNAFYTQLNKNKSIRRLSFNNVDLQDGQLFSRCLLQFFQNNTKLTSLSVTHRFAGSDQLLSALSTKPTSLKYLDLSYVDMTDATCRILCTALEANHLGLRSLELNGNRLKHGGCVAIATLLVNPNCVLNRLCLEHNQIDNQGAVALSNGLVNNKHLKTLLLHGNTAMTLQGMNSLMKTVCNFTNVTDIINSNHTLQTLTLPTRVRFVHQNVELEKKSKLSMQYSLRFNNRGSSNQMSSSSNSVNSNKNKVSYIINQKVVLHHFILSNINIQLYEQLPGHLLPRLLSSIANYEVYNTKRSDEFASKDELFAKKDYNRRHVALHRFIRLCPSICERWVGGGSSSSNVVSQVEGPGEVDSSIKRMRCS